MIEQRKENDVELIKRKYCFNCKEVFATVKVVSPCGDMVEWVCGECFEKRPDGWEAEDCDYHDSSR